MKTPRRESGSTLILVIGVVAAISILSAALVILLSNVQANTSREGAQKMSFSASEAALDAAMAQVSAAWPGKEGGNASFDQAAYLQEYLDGVTAAGYPAPTVTVAFFDNSGTGGSLSDSSIRRDANGDNRLWIEATATVGQRSTRIRVLAERVMQNLGLLDNIAVWTPGVFDSQSAASSVTYEVLGPGASQAVVEYGSTASGSRPLDDTVKPISPATSADLLISPELLDFFRSEATRVDTVGLAKRYDSTAAVPNSVNGWTGLVYVDSGAASGSRQLTSTQSVQWPFNAVINGDGVASNPKPGVLIVDAQLLTIQGNSTYYGLVYCTGAIRITSGGLIHGMVLAAGENVSGTAVYLSGNQSVIYNDNVRANLNRQYSISVRQVANTWRELSAY